MKITYPECQVEITAEELITVIDRLSLYSAGASLVKAIEDIKINLRPEDFPQDGDGEAPEPKPYPSEEEPAPTYEPGGIIGDGERSPVREGVRPGGLPAAVQEALKHPHVVSKKEAKKKKSSGKPKKVDVLFETGWKTFGSLTEAAKAIDARMNHLSHALLTGKTCNGHQVRYSNPELDAALAEIEESKKKPYQPTPPIR